MYKDMYEMLHRAMEDEHGIVRIFSLLFPLREGSINEVHVNYIHTYTQYVHIWVCEYGSYACHCCKYLQDADINCILIRYRNHPKHFRMKPWRYFVAMCCQLWKSWIIFIWIADIFKFNENKYRELDKLCYSIEQICQAIKWDKSFLESRSTCLDLNAIRKN